MISRSASEASFILVDEHSQEQKSSTGTSSNVSPTSVLSTIGSVALHNESPAPRVKTANSTFAHDWSQAGTGGQLSIHGRHFVDAHGRVCHLRGVNVSGNCKTPANHDHDSFPANHAEVTFVGRPFSLNEAPEHFARLRRWGLTFIRFLVTWEAIEHAGPGVYDMEYLEYLRSLLSLLPQFGMAAFVVMHQDVWSRYSGGSGAPAWTLEAAGFDLHGLEEPGAAWLKGVKGGGHVEDERGLWPCGYQKLAAATMATCFWAGDTFAPKLRVRNPQGEQVSIQTFLQSTFIDMWAMVAKTLGDVEGLVGFEMMNEPHRGYIELQSMHEFDYNTDLHLGHVPTAFQSFMLGAGHPTAVGHWTRSWPFPTRLTSQKVINTAKQKAWRDDGPTQGRCLWEIHGVWGWDNAKDQGVVLRESYFKKHPMTGQKVEWYTDFYYPLVNRWAERVRSVSEAKIVFLEPIPNEFCPSSWTKDRRPADMVYAPHWYDLNALFSKSFRDFSVNVQGLSRGMFILKALYWGQQGARDNFSLQIQNIVEAGYRYLGEMPVIIGECGLPMDMNKGEAFASDNWVWQSRMMDAMITALERSLIGFTLWNYNPDNNDHTGDDWNGENFSWFSRRRGLTGDWLDLAQTSPTLDNGARILRSLVRPYPAKTAGIPLRFDYEINTGRFTFKWAVPGIPGKSEVANASPSVRSPPLTDHPVLTSKETEIFMPSMLAHSRKVVVKGLGAKDSYRYDESRQTLTVVTEDMTPGAVNQITVTLQPPLKTLFELNSLWSDFGGHFAAVTVLFVAFVVYFVLSYLDYE